MGKRKILTAVSIIALLAGLISAIGRQAMEGGTDAFNLGVDFQGGTVATVKFKEKPSPDAIRNALQGIVTGDTIIQESTDKTDEVLIKVPTQGRREECPNVDEAGRCLIKNALDKSFGKEAEATLALGDDPNAAYKIVGTESVGPVAGEQLRNQAVAATLLGLLGILLYIAYRYDWTYAAGAVIAVFHDVLVTLAFFTR